MKLLSVLSRTWIDSIKFLLPPAIKLNLLFFLNAIIQAGKTLWREKAVLLLGLGIWIIYVLLTAIPVFFDPVKIPYLGKAGIYALIMAAFGLLVWFLVLLVRPSVARKDIEYFFHNFLSFNRFFILFVLLSYVQILLFNFLNYIDVRFLHFSPLSAFAFYFWFDGKNSVKNIFLSIWRSAKMIFYNFPFALLSCVIFFFTSLFFRNLGTFVFKNNFLMYLVAPLMEIAFLMLALTWYSIFYTQKSHEQYNLYFKTK